MMMQSNDESMRIEQPRNAPWDLAKWNRRRRRKLAKDSGAFKRHIRPREIASAKVKR